MLGSATDYLEKLVLQHTLRIAAMPQPAALFLALCTTATPSTDAIAGSEVVGGAYARQALAMAMAAGRNDAANNTATIEYPAATAAWGTIGFLEIWDAAAAGNRLYWGPLVDPTDGVTVITRPIASGDIMRLPAGSVVVTAD